MEERYRKKEEGEEWRRKEIFKRRQVGLERWRSFPIPPPLTKNEYNLLDAKKQHIATKYIPYLPLEGNRAARSGG